MEDLQIIIDWENRTATVASDDLSTETLAVVEVDKTETATVLDVQKKDDESFLDFFNFAPLLLIISVFSALFLIRLDS